MQARRKDPAKSSRNAPVSSPARETESGQPKNSQTEALNPEQEKIAAWLKRVRFKKRLLGGVKEDDVWKKIGELNTLYEAALAAEHARCEAMIDYYKKTCTAAVQKYREAAISASARRERTGDE